MLTTKKFQQLVALTDHPKFGKLLKNAIINWNTYNQIRFKFGIIGDIDSIWCVDEFKQCCLIGSSLIGIRVHHDCSKTSTVVEEYNITRPEFWGLSDGFDNSICCHTDFTYVNAYVFDKTVGEICFGN